MFELLELLAVIPLSLTSLSLGTGLLLGTFAGTMIPVRSAAESHS